MLDGIKRWFSGEAAPAPAREWEALAAWANGQGLALRPVRDAEGFVIEGPPAKLAWRLEWGPSQRGYIKGPELRLRCELGLPLDLQAVAMNRALQEQMETEVFDQYVEGVQTRIDTETPPEMRWLVMFPKLGTPDMGALRERFVALSSYKPWAVAWLQGPFAAALEASTFAPETPLVLMIARGRLTLRSALDVPEAQVLANAISLFETAAREAHRVGDMRADTGAPSTTASLWGPSQSPGDAGDEPK